MGEQADRAVTLLVRNFFVINAIWALPLGSIEWLLSNVRALRATFDTGIACLIALLLLWWLSSFLIRPIFLILTEANEGRRYSLRAVAAESRKVWLKQLVTLASLTALRLVLVVGAYILAAYCATFALAIYRNEVAQSLPYAAQVVIVTALVLACIAIIVAYIPLNYAEAIAFGVCIFERPDVFSAIGKGLRQTFAGRNLRHAFVAGLAVFAIEMGSWAIQYGIHYLGTIATLVWLPVPRAAFYVLGAELQLVLMFVLYNNNRVVREGLDLSRAVTEMAPAPT